MYEVLEGATDARWHAALAAALLLAACGPGDHARSAELNRFFGAGAAGTAMNSQAAKPAETEEQSVIPSSGSTPPRNASAGAKAPVVQMPGTQLGASSASAAGGMVATGGSTAMPAANSGGGGASASKPSMPDATKPPAPAAAGNSAVMMCPAGQMAVGTQCVCDLNGSFALHASIPVSSAAMGPVEALNGTMHVWSLLRQQYDASGNLSMSMSVCGQTSPDLCASAQPPVLSAPEAYGQYIPVEAWNRASEAPASAQLSIASPLPGAAIDTPPLAQLFGISLSNPLGPWPASFKDVQGSGAFDGSATNGAAWVDTDADGKSGVTLRIVGAGGAMGNGASGPMQSYGSTSAECPRTNAQSARSPYAYLPLAQGLGVKRIKALYTAQRIAFELHGLLDSCDQASGAVTGGNGGALAFHALIGGCSMVSGSGETDCTQAVIDTASANGGVSGLKLGTGSFTWTRLPAEATCAEVRAMREAHNDMTSQ